MEDGHFWHFVEAGYKLQRQVIAFKVVVALYKRLAGGLHYFYIVCVVLGFRKESFQREVRKRVLYIWLHIIAPFINAGATVYKIACPQDGYAVKQGSFVALKYACIGFRFCPLPVKITFVKVSPAPARSKPFLYRKLGKISFPVKASLVNVL